MRRLAALGAIVISLSGCSFGYNLVQRIRIHHAVALQDYKTALNILDHEIADNPNTKEALQASRRGAHIAHMLAQNYTEAVRFYKDIILFSPDSEERKIAQRKIAQIYFENLRDYENAIIGYERLLEHGPTPGEKFQYRFNIAKSQYRLNNMDQALVETETLLGQKLQPEQIFDVKVLKANILVAHKEQEKAAELWEQIMGEFPDRSKRDKIALNLLVCYEELKSFDKAIAILQKMRETDPHPDFIDLQIKRLRERELNQPGAHGLKR